MPTKQIETNNVNESLFAQKGPSSGRKNNLAIAWMNYKKAYDRVPHLWIKECLDLFGVAENIKALIVNSMEKWRVMLCERNSELGEVDIKRGIFKEDCFSPLVFVLH